MITQTTVIRKREREYEPGLTLLAGSKKKKKNPSQLLTTLDKFLSVL